jgi:hypothetical protein
LHGKLIIEVLNLLVKDKVWTSLWCSSFTVFMHIAAFLP